MHRIAKKRQSMWRYRRRHRDFSLPPSTFSAARRDNANSCVSKRRFMQPLSPLDSLSRMIAGDRAKHRLHKPQYLLFLSLRLLCITTWVFQADYRSNRAPLIIDIYIPAPFEVCTVYFSSIEKKLS